ncbi:MAG: hypothetical protein OMM_03607 [Candidatus Magnetoglobus multicellularis str. Araruama]|uniref:Uncharacterized protein n=1 Tax=Candidatus Magnetoglobus multicellularis str. Araruama TaxID=890399 RepID=A0A1V1P5A8_9BACT|nr:MAG: hypothetical protein OMM_03607 [Candidatus Magnetoglobus multicellularis str. Araruama]
MPQSLVLNPRNNSISGTFSETGEFYFTMQVIDATGAEDTENYSIVVVDELVMSTPLWLTPSRFPSAICHTSYPKQNKIDITGGMPPYTVALCETSDLLPQSMFLSSDSNDGTIYIEGMPSIPGSYSFSICVNSRDGQYTSKSFLLDVVDPLVITTQRLYDGIISKSYHMKLEAEGGYGAYRWMWNLNASEGLKLNAETGEITGEPVNQLYKTVMISAVDADGHTAHTYLYLDINPEIEIKENSLPKAQKGKFYSENIPISGGFPPYTFSCNCPEGLSISRVTGIIQGIPAENESTTVPISVNDSRFPYDPNAFTKDLIIKISDNVIIKMSGNLPPVLQNKPIEPVNLVAIGDAPPYTWEVISGHMPQGITINEQNQLEGTPEFNGNYSFSLAVHAAQSTDKKDFSMFVYQPLKITTSVIKEPRIDTDYFQEFSTSGGYGEKYWHYIGFLPEGLIFDPTTGTIRGIAKKIYSAYEFFLEVIDADGNTAQKPFTMEVLGKPVEITNHSIFNGYLGIAYSASIYASWGTPEYTWKIINGFLPDGLQLNTTGPANPVIIEGNPTREDTYHFTVQVMDKSSGINTAQKEFTIQIKEISNITIFNSYLKDAQLNSDENAEYSDNIVVMNGTSPYVFDIVKGKLPAGLNLNADTGEIKGIVTPESQTEELTIRVKEKDHPEHVFEKEFLLLVVKSLAIKTQGIHATKQFRPYEDEFKAEDGISPYWWSISEGHLPAGLTLNPTTGKITGKPFQCGDFPLTLKVRDSAKVPTVLTRSLSNFKVVCEDMASIISILNVLSGFDEKSDLYDENALLGNKVHLHDAILRLRSVGEF